MSETKLTAVGAASPHRARTAAQVTLVVHEGATENPTTRVIELADGASITMGRAKTCEVQIDSDQVSRTHATFVRNGQVVEVTDAGSRNGTWVNGEVISGARRVVSGDEVQVGSATVFVSITSHVAQRTRFESTRYLDERLAAEVDRGLHYQRRMGLALIRLDGANEILDSVTDAIAAALRPMDVIAEYAPSVLAVILPELDAAATEHAVRSLVTMEGAPISGLEIAVGVAGFPEHSTSAAGLIARARAALESVKRGDETVVAMPPDDQAPVLADVVVGDPQMVRVYELVRLVASHPITVLISGETGVGKEVIAAAIHAASARKRGPLVRVNCASLPESLLESALFGHERGAFTGAERKKVGYFEAAHGGTLFLDEIGEMTPALQAKLLRVLEHRTIIRVGGVDEIEIDVRVVCATHRDLQEEVKQNTFRSDLYFRVTGFTILVPPLRQRIAEIEPLARIFLQQSAATLQRLAPSIAPEALDALKRYDWPGNVRELRNAIERAMVLHTGGVIHLEDLPDALRETRITTIEANLGGHRDIRDHIAAMERDAIATALEITRGNQTEAAKQLGISRRTLIYRMEKHGLKPPPGRRTSES